MTTLKFSWGKESLADMHLIYRTVQICLGGGMVGATDYRIPTTAVFSLGKPCLVKGLSINVACAKEARSLSGRIAVLPTTFTPYRELIQSYWSDPERLYREVTGGTLKPDRVVAEHRSQYEFGYAGAPKRSFSFTVPIDQVGIILSYSVVLSSDEELTINDVYGEVETEPCTGFFTELLTPKMQFPQPGDEVEFGVTIGNRGRCLGRGDFSYYGNEVSLWLDAGETVTYRWTEKIGLERLEVPLRSLFDKHISLPEARKIVPSFERVRYWEETAGAEPVRFLNVGGTKMTIKGDKPGGESISYTGIVAGTGLKAEGASIRETKRISSTAFPLPIPAIVLRETLNPLDIATISYSKLIYAEFTFGKDVMILENGAMKQRSAKEYRFTSYPVLMPFVLLGKSDVK